MLWASPTSPPGPRITLSGPTGIAIDGAGNLFIADYFNSGTLQVGDVLTVTESGAGSLRGTNPDPFVRLYRAGSASIITSNDDSGPGLDSLIYRFPITVADTYYVRAYRFGSTDLGSYQLGIWLENSGAAPATGATFTTEVEPNETTGGADNASPEAYALQWASTQPIASALVARRARGKRRRCVTGPGDSCRDRRYA